MGNVGIKTQNSSNDLAVICFVEKCSVWFDFTLNATAGLKRKKQKRVKTGVCLQGNKRNTSCGKYFYLNLLLTSHVLKLSFFFSRQNNNIDLDNDNDSELRWMGKVDKTCLFLTFFWYCIEQMFIQFHVKMASWENVGLGKRKCRGERVRMTDGLEHRAQKCLLLQHFKIHYSTSGDYCKDGCEMNVKSQFISYPSQEQ